MDWNSIVEDLGPRLFKYFCARFDVNHADDLTQETLIRLVQKVNEGSYNSVKGSLSVYAFGIAHYVSCEAKSERHHHQEIQSLDLDVFADSEDLEANFLNKSSIENLRGHLEKLSFNEQQIMALLIDEDLTLNQISMIIEIPESTVKSHVFRAKKKLIKYINQEGLM